MTRRVAREEIEEMHRAYIDGCLTMEEVGRAFGRSGDRVGRLFRREGLPAITNARRGTARTVAERLEMGDNIAGASPRYDRDYLVDCLRMAATEDGTDVLTSKRYRELGAEWGLPSAARIIQVFGSWGAACEAAGLRMGRQLRRDYTRRFSYEDVLEAVRACAAELGHPPSDKQYDEWQRGKRPAPGKGSHGPYPSATQARNVRRDRRWVLIMADALGAPG